MGITEQTTPYSARLLWTIAKSRRKTGDFIGSEILAKELETKTPIGGRFRCGIAKHSQKGRAIREGMDLYAGKELVGTVCSGAVAANCDGLHSIGQGYINKEFSKVGTELVAMP